MISDRMDGERVIVFGGSSGVGLAVSEQCLARGAQVTIASRTRKRLDAAAAQLGAVETIAVDIQDAEEVARIFEERDAFDHVVVSAAELQASPLRSRHLAEARAAMDSKLWGALHVAHAASIRDGGSLTLVSGMLSVRPSGGATVLSVINAALDTLAKALATEMAPVRVNCVSPGRLDTPWWDHLPEEKKRALLDATAARLPVKRVGHADEIAGQIVHIMLNGFMTGSVILVDGGGSVS